MDGWSESSSPCSSSFSSRHIHCVNNQISLDFMALHRPDCGLCGPVGDTFYERRPRTSQSKPQWVWPKDKHQSFGGRLKDVLSGKGPDIFINLKGDPGPHRSVWSGWNQHGLTCNINQYGYTTVPALWSERNHHGERFGAMPLPKSAERREREGQVYDFRKRRYQRKGRADWSDAHRSRENPERVLYARDRYGHSYYHENFPEDGRRFGEDTGSHRRLMR